MGDFRNKYSGNDRNRGSRDGLLGAVLGEVGKRFGDKASGGHGTAGNVSGGFGRDARETAVKAAPRSRMPGFGSTAALVVLVVWTLLAWGGYSLVDGVLAWTSSNAGALVQTGRDAAAATGIGSEVVGVVGNAETSGMLGGFFALLSAVLKPLVVVVWMVGAVLIMAAPRLVSLLTRKFR